MSIRLDQNSFDCQGECPICGSPDLNYDESWIDNMCVYYDRECNNCHSQWTEWYTMDFYSQHVDYDWLQKKNTDNPDRDREPKSHI